MNHYQICWDCKGYFTKGERKYRDNENDPWSCLSCVLKNRDIDPKQEAESQTDTMDEMQKFSHMIGKRVTVKPETFAGPRNELIDRGPYTIKAVQFDLIWLEGVTTPVRADRLVTA